MEGLDGGIAYVEWRGPGNRCRGWPSTLAPSPALSARLAGPLRGPPPPPAGGGTAAGRNFFTWRGRGRQKYCHGRPRCRSVGEGRGGRVYAHAEAGGRVTLAGGPQTWPRPPWATSGSGGRGHVGRPRATQVPKYRGRVTGAPVYGRPPGASVATPPMSQVATAGSLCPRAWAVPPVRGRPEPREVAACRLAQRREGRVTLPPAVGGRPCRRRDRKARPPPARCEWAAYRGARAG